MLLALAYPLKEVMVQTLLVLVEVYVCLRQCGRQDHHVVTRVWQTITLRSVQGLLDGVYPAVICLIFGGWFHRITLHTIDRPFADLRVVFGRNMHSATAGAL